MNRECVRWLKCPTDCATAMKLIKLIWCAGILLARSWENQLTFGTDEARKEHSGHQVSSQRTNLCKMVTAQCLLGAWWQQSRAGKVLNVLTILVVAAHHGPSPAFQTIILDRACPGSILKDSRHPGGGQKVFPGFLEMHHFCPANRSTHQVL